jgi:hypothetical protein
MHVPLVDIVRQSRAVKNEVLILWEEILDSGGFVGGKHVAALEEEFAEACGVRHCVSVNSGTDALRFIFIALGLQQGDEVITVPNTFIGTTEAISQAGGKIVFVDVNSDTYNIDPEKIVPPGPKALCRFISTAKQRIWIRFWPSPRNTDSGSLRMLVRLTSQNTKDARLVPWE